MKVEDVFARIYTVTVVVRTWIVNNYTVGLELIDGSRSFTWRSVSHEMDQ